MRVSASCSRHLQCAKEDACSGRSTHHRVDHHRAATPRSAWRVVTSREIPIFVKAGDQPSLTGCARIHALPSMAAFSPLWLCDGGDTLDAGFTVRACLVRSRCSATCRQRESFPSYAVREESVRFPLKTLILIKQSYFHLFSRPVGFRRSGDLLEGKRGGRSPQVPGREGSRRNVSARCAVSSGKDEFGAVRTGLSIESNCCGPHCNGLSLGEDSTGLCREWRDLSRGMKRLGESRIG